MTRFALLALAAAMVAAPAAAEPVRLHAAGSLRAALTETAEAFTRQTAVPVAPVFGASGLLKDRIAGGEASDLFASANMQHPEALARGRPVVLFARNRLCGLSRPGLGVTSANLLKRMLDPSVRVAMSTPHADPSGDYALALFAKAEAVRPGSRTLLERKALQLTGGPDSAKPPAGRSVYGWILERGDADLFLTYCTNAQAAAAGAPGLEIVQVPEALAVGADYGLIVLSDRPEAASLAMFILSVPGQKILARHGFVAPNLPATQSVFKRSGIRFA